MTESGRVSRKMPTGYSKSLEVTFEVELNFRDGRVLKMTFVKRQFRRLYHSLLILIAKFLYSFYLYIPNYVGEKDCDDLFKIISYVYYRATVRNCRGREEIESCSSLLGHGGLQDNKMLDEGYENFSSPGYIASHQHGFIRIFIADFSIFFPRFIFLFICFILFSHRVLLMEYLKYGHKLGFWEGRPRI